MALINENGDGNDAGINVDDFDSFGDDEAETEVETETETETKPPEAKPDESADDDEFPDFGNLDGLVDKSKPEESAEEKFDKETEESAKGLPEDAGRKFKELRAELKSLKLGTTPNKAAEQELTDLRAKVQELSDKAAEAEALREKVTKITEKDARIAVETSDEFARRVTSPIKAMDTRLSQIAELTGVSADTLADIVTGDDETAEALLTSNRANLSDRLRHELYGLSGKFRDAEAARSELLSDAEKSYETITKQREQETTQQAERRRVEARAKQRETFEKYSKNIPGISDNGALTELGKSIQAKVIATDHEKLTVDDVAYATMAAHVLPGLVKELRRVNGDLANLKKGATTKKIAGEGSQEETSDGDENLSLIDKMKKEGIF